MALDVRLPPVSFQIFGASGDDHSPGLVPDPGGTAGATRFIREDGQWATAIQSLGIFTATQPGLVPASNGGTVNFLRADATFAPPPTFPAPTLPTFVNVLAYGADPTGTNDNSAALTLAIGALGPTGGVIYFPMGKYLFNEVQQFTYPAAGVGTGIFDVTVLGDGEDASILYWSNSNGINIALNNSSTAVNNQSFHARDISFTTGQPPTSGFYALTVQQAGSNNGSFASLTEFTRVTFRGGDGIGNVDGWDIDLNLIGVSNINVNGCLFQGPSTAGGIGIQLGGLSISDIVAVHNITGTTFNLKTIGLQIANAFIQGVTIDQSNFTACTAGINIPTLAGLVNGAALAQLCITNSQFGLFTSNSNAIAAASGSPIASLMVATSLFLLDASSTAGIVAPLQNFCIVGSTFQSSTTSGTVGVSVTSNPSNTASVVTGNIFAGLAIGIALQSGTHNINVGPNTFAANTTNVANAAPAANGNIGTWISSQGNGFGFIIQNAGGAAGDDGIVVAAGANASSDSTTAMVAFATGNNSAQVGSITRSGTGVAYNTSSDRNLKRDIASTRHGLAVLRRLQVVDFGFPDDDTGARHQGFIAQDVHQHCPWVVRAGDERRPWGLDYGRLSSLSIRGTQELADIVDIQADTIKELRGLNSGLEARVVDLEHAMAEMVDKFAD